MKDKNLPNDYNSLTLEELTQEANKMIKDLENQKDLKNAVETLHVMYHSALGGRITPNEIHRRLNDWEIREKVRPEYKEDFTFLVNSTKTLAFQNG